MTSAETYEYRRLFRWQTTDLDATLQRLGSQGWQLLFEDKDGAYVLSRRTSAQKETE